MKYMIVITAVLFAMRTFACTTTVSVLQSSPDFADARSVVENVMENFKAAHIASQRSNKTSNGGVQLFCFIAASSDYVDLIRSHLKGVMSSYSGVSVSNVSGIPNDGNNQSSSETLTCKSSKVIEAIHTCFDRRPNCPLSSYCSWAYEWYDRCSTTRPNRYCF